MDLRLFDSAERRVLPLQLREPGKLSMYVCGPTVYDYPHIGHGRAMLTWDILRRYVESQGIEVHHVSNVTDIDDKIIERANQSGRSTDDVVAEFEEEWWKAFDALGAKRPHQIPHATEYVKQMVELIEVLMDKGFAYETSNTVYFSPTNVDRYGLLAQQSLESLQAGARVEGDVEKRTPIDFALWKKAKQGEPSWPSPWGDGRPGWHTECVVMSLDLLGDGFDLHGGGLDLMFPHHENERAQAVALGHEFSKHWSHNGFIEVNGEKMSKSLGNFVTLPEMLAHNDSRAYRMVVLRAHYRSPVEVTPETLKDATSALARLDDFARRFSNVEMSEPTAAFKAHMDNDLDTPQAVAEIFTQLRAANAALDANNANAANELASSVLAMCSVLGLELGGDEAEIDEQTLQLMEQRDAARASKDWALADALRNQLTALGWVVEDTSEGTQVHR